MVISVAEPLTATLHVTGLIPAWNKILHLLDLQVVVPDLTVWGSTLVQRQSTRNYWRNYFLRKKRQGLHFFFHKPSYGSDWYGSVVIWSLIGSAPLVSWSQVLLLSMGSWQKVLLGFSNRNLTVVAVTVGVWKLAVFQPLCLRVYPLVLHLISLR